MSELRECPFCKGEAEVYGARHEYFVECHHCRMGGTNNRWETPDKAITAWNRRTQPDNPPLTLIFGNGNIGVSSCSPDGKQPNELLLWNPHDTQKIGNEIDIPKGLTTDDVDVYARLIFNKPESVQVVTDALERIKGNPPLSLEQLRQMCQPGFKKVYDPVWIKTIPDGKISCQLTRDLIKTDVRYKVPKQWVDAHSVNLLLTDYAKTWTTYAHKPEKDGDEG